MEGRVKLKDPEVTLAYLEFYGVDPNAVPEEPYGVFFGKWVRKKCIYYPLGFYIQPMVIAEAYKIKIVIVGGALKFLNYIL